MRRRNQILTVFFAAILLIGATAFAEDGPEGQGFDGGPGREDEEREYRGGPREGEDVENFGGGPREGGDVENFGGGPREGEDVGNFDGGPGGEREEFGPGNERMGGGTVDKSSDEDLNALLAETEEKFSQIDYQDEETGLAFSYNLFIPDDYEETQSYPLVLFIADSSVTGRETKAALTQGYGAVVWAGAEDQAKHPCFILAPMYPENILEGEEAVTDYVPATLNLLTELEQSYSIDTDRLYMTGQSMGCMTGLYLNGTFPDLFAASLYVDGQWDTEILKPLEEQTFFYFAAEGDEKAFAGMENVIAMFDADSVPYAETVLNAKDPDEEINAGITALLEEGCSANFVSWEQGSVLPEDAADEMGSEHMYSFDHAYQSSALRDWLFEQKK